MKRLILLALLLVPMTAFAHPGHTEHGFTSGLLHPITGIDHLAMLLTVGVFAAVAGKKSYWLVASLAALCLGAYAGNLFGSFSYMETMVAASLLVGAALLLLPDKLKAFAWCLPLLMLFHGYAHGVSTPASTLHSFILGSAISAAVLLAVGYIAGMAVRRYPIIRNTWAVGLAGVFAVVVLVL